MKNSKLQIYKIDAQGDTIYIEALSESDAVSRLMQVMGHIPRSLLTLAVVKELPDGEELL